MRFLDPEFTLRPETELLLCCARARSPEATSACIGDVLQREIDWEYLLADAQRHGMMPLLYWHLNGARRIGAPGTILNRLSNAFTAHAASNLCLTTELLQILSIFESHSVRALCYKGPSLAAFAYGNLLLRPFGDLDILVRPQDLAAAENLLINQGYRRAFHSNREAAEYAHKFLHKDRPIEVELHWSVLPPHEALPLNLESLWEHVTSVEISGQKILLPMTDDLLLILSWHGYKHRWERLEWLCCIAHIIGLSPPLNWMRLFEKATRSGSRRVLFLALLLAHELLQTPYLNYILERMRADSTVAWLMQEVYRGLFAPCALDAQPVKGGRFFRLKSRERCRDKARYCLWVLRSEFLQRRAQ